MKDRPDTITSARYLGKSRRSIPARVGRYADFDTRPAMLWCHLPLRRHFEQHDKQ